MATVKIDVSELPVDAVCVFQANRAEVHRVIPVALLPGQNEIVIQQLPNVIDPDSIQVEGLGNAVISDVVYSPSSASANVPSSSGDASIKLAKREMEDIKAQTKILNDQLNVLDGYSKTVQASTTDAKTLGKFLDVYLSTRRQVYKELADLTERSDAAEKKLAALRKAAYNDDHSKKRGVKVTVVVHARERGRGELSLRYMVTGAAWQPMYDLRAKISTSSKIPSSISLQYRASIAQQTGEDWSDVDLTLSTASPQKGSDIPQLPSYRIGHPLPIYVPPPPPQLLAMPMVMKSAARRAPSMSESEVSDEDMGFALAEEASTSKPLAVRIAAAVEGATSSTFVISGKSSIPSDGDDGSSTHKVSIAVIDLSADLEWITVPKLQTAAFLRCQVKNTSSYIFLEGPANVYIDGGFICKTNLSTVNPQESFSTSLGIDPAVRITYHNLQKKSKTSSGGLLGPKYDSSSFTQRITIKNTRTTPIRPLYVKDQVPVSEDNDVKVVVLDPVGLDSAKERKEVLVTQGIKARWGYKEKEEGVEDAGVVEFVCDIAASKSVDLTLSWDVLTPAGKGGWVRK